MDTSAAGTKTLTIMGIWLDHALDRAHDAGQILEWETDGLHWWVGFHDEIDMSRAGSPSRESACFAWVQRTFRPAADAPDGPPRPASNLPYR